jgi:hypothetical protein
MPCTNLPAKLPTPVTALVARPVATLVATPLPRLAKKAVAIYNTENHYLNALAGFGRA